MTVNAEAIWIKVINDIVALEKLLSISIGRLRFIRNTVFKPIIIRYILNRNRSNRQSSLESHVTSQSMQEE